MILDNLSQWHRYTALGTRFEKAFHYLETVSPDTPLGRYDLEGEELFAMVSAYPTRSADQFKFEAHRRYADVQFIVAGRERILWVPLASLPTVTEAYNAEKDILFCAPPTSHIPLNMAAGQFAVFFPEDGHAPGLEWGGIGEVLKVVLKVRV
ncbi:MAG: YhcH/YjgK/YiaL family protein [Verrucomicrobiota bacterium]